VRIPALDWREISIVIGIYNGRERYLLWSRTVLSGRKAFHLNTYAWKCYVVRFTRLQISFTNETLAEFYQYLGERVQAFAQWSREAPGDPKWKWWVRALWFSPNVYNGNFRLTKEAPIFAWQPKHPPLSLFVEAFCHRPRYNVTVCLPPLPKSTWLCIIAKLEWFVSRTPTKVKSWFVFIAT